jgi:hypothetical protein
MLLKVGISAYKRYFIYHFLLLGRIKKAARKGSPLFLVFRLRHYVAVRRHVFFRVAAEAVIAKRLSVRVAFGDEVKA